MTSCFRGKYRRMSFLGAGVISPRGSRSASLTCASIRRAVNLPHRSHIRNPNGKDQEAGCGLGQTGTRAKLAAVYSGGNVTGSAVCRQNSGVGPRTM